MFPFPIATPQGCNIQTFYGSGVSSNITPMSWNKPVGVSHVYMMLIGAGGTGDGTNGGGSGAVTVWYGAAQHVPDNLVLQIPADQVDDTYIRYRNRSVIAILLRASSGAGPTAGTAVTAGPFAASGFYKSTAGQDGFAANTTASTTTFLSGGTSQTGSVTANYGYSLPTTTGDFAGIFQMQPIIVGLGSKGTGRGAIGCGGGLNSGAGGSGMILIASW